MRKKKEIAELQVLLDSISPPNYEWKRFLEKLRSLLNSMLKFDHVSVGNFFQVMDYTKLCGSVYYERNFYALNDIHGAITLEKTVFIDLKQPLEPQLEAITKEMGRLSRAGYEILKDKTSPLIVQESPCPHPKT